MITTKRPIVEDDEALELLLQPDDLTQWEAQFCECIAEQECWSVKQAEKLNELCERYFMRRQPWSVTLG